jgi:hypothetical protein
VALFIDTGSLTDWVERPSLLNANAAEGRVWRQPNMVRYTVIFDCSAPVRGPSQGAIQGVDNLWVRATTE